MMQIFVVTLMTLEDRSELLSLEDDIRVANRDAH